MLYKYLDKKEEQEYIVDENNLRKELYEQALDDLKSNFLEYLDETGPFELSKMLDVFKVAIHGSINDVIKAFEQIWGCGIILVDEDSIL